MCYSAPNATWTKRFCISKLQAKVAFSTGIGTGHVPRQWVLGGGRWNMPVSQYLLWQVPPVSLEKGTYFVTIPCPQFCPFCTICCVMWLILAIMAAHKLIIKSKRSALWKQLPQNLGKTIFCLMHICLLRICLLKLGRGCTFHWCTCT